MNSEKVDLKYIATTFFVKTVKFSKIIHLIVSRVMLDNSVIFVKNFI